MLSRAILRTTSRQCARVGARAYSSAGEQPTPPMLLRIRKDLKDAMRAKDTNKLSVLRTLLSQTLNASKTSSPVLTDMHMLALIRKNKAAAQTAADEFLAAKRQDLADKELAQLKVYEEYMAGVEVVGEEEVRSAVAKAIEELKAGGKELHSGEIMWKLFKAPEAGLADKNVDKALVAKVVREMFKPAKEGETVKGQ